jgi:hypothetical protein
MMMPNFHRALPFLTDESHGIGLFTQSSGISTVVNLCVVIGKFHLHAFNHDIEQLIDLISQSRSDILEIEISGSHFSVCRSTGNVYLVADISLYGHLPKVGMTSWDDFFCVRISVCNQLRATGWALRSYKWNKIHRL